jgi:hypothetical protein
MQSLGVKKEVCKENGPLSSIHLTFRIPGAYLVLILLSKAIHGTQ